MTIQEQMGIDLDINTPVKQQDMTDVASDTIDPNESLSYVKGVFRQSSGVDPIDVNIEESNDHLFPTYESNPEYIKALMTPDVKGGLSWAGQGIASMSELFTRYNKIATAFPLTEQVMATGKTSTKLLNMALKKSFQWYGRKISNGELTKDGINSVIDSVGGDTSAVTSKELLYDMTALYNPIAWKSFGKAIQEAATEPYFQATDEELQAGRKALGLDKLESPTFGEKLGQDYYETLTGKNPSDAWKNLVNFSAETLLTTPITAAKTIKGGLQTVKLFPQTPLSKLEIDSLKSLYTNWGVAKLTKSPEVARAELKLASGLSKYSSDVKLQKYLELQAVNWKKQFSVLMGKDYTEMQVAREISKEQLESGRGILDAILSNIEPAQKQANAEKALSLSRKFRKSSMAKDTGRGESSAKMARSALKGDDYIHDFDVDLSFMNQEMRDSLFDVASSLPLWDAQHAYDGLWNILSKQLPSRSQVRAMEMAFGGGVLDKIESLIKTRISPSDIIADLGNVSRSMQSAFDISPGFRQGELALKAGYATEWGNAFNTMIKAGTQKGYAEQIDRLSHTGIKAAVYRESGLTLTDVSRFSSLGQREELIMSNLAERIPVIGKGIKWSEQTYSAFMNQLRMNIFDSTIAFWNSEGRTLDPKDYKALADYVNHLTGRGDLKTADKIIEKAFGLFGKQIDIKKTQIPSWVSGFLYAPKFLVSKVQVYTDLLSTDSNLVRKMIARDLVKYYYTNMQLLNLAKLGEKQFGWTVETDPTATNFGKIMLPSDKYNHGYNVWGSSSDLMKLVARLQTGTIKAQGTGNIRNVSRADILLRFGRSKLSPTAGLFVDIGTGETFLGGDVDASDAKGIAELVVSKHIPMSAKDIIDAFRFSEQGGWLNQAMSTSSLVGIGVENYEKSPFQQSYIKKEKLSQELFGKQIKDLDVGERFQLFKISSIDPEIQQLERKGMFERSDDMGEFTATENRKAEKDIKNNLPTDVRSIIDKSYTGITGIKNSIDYRGNILKLNNKEFGVYKKIVAEKITENIKTLSYSGSELLSNSDIIDRYIKSSIQQANAEMIVLILDTDSIKSKKSKENK